MLKTFLIFSSMAALVGWLAYFYWKVLRRSLTSHRIESPFPGVKIENFDLERNPGRYWFGIGTLGMASASFAAMATALLMSALFVH
jgi:hypothetical protein